MDLDDLVVRVGLYCEKFTATPFTGEVDEGLLRGSFKNGKKDGSWEGYYEDGSVWKNWTGTFKNNVKVLLDILRDRRAKATGVAWRPSRRNVKRLSV